MEKKRKETFTIESLDQAAALLNPLRVEILAQLKEPHSAAEVARQLKETPQRINYHLKALERVGLVERAGSRQVRNLVEVLYRSIARTFLLAESLPLGHQGLQKLKDQSALQHLIRHAEQIKKDALILMERSEEEIIPSASVQMKITLQGEEQRRQFLQEYVDQVKQLIKKYGHETDSKDTYQVSLAIYPDVIEEDEDEKE
jgi:DNA-binding transcriptional ArsR family regulator